MAGSILIVDDVSTNRIVLKAMLSGARYTTSQAASGAQALAVAAAEQPGLVLLDVDLPDMTGIEVITRLRADPATRRIPVVAVTTHTTPEMRLDLLRAGANEILAKPFNELLMLARLRSLLREHGTDAEFALREATCRELGFAEARNEYTSPARVAMIAAQPEMALRWKNALSQQMPDDMIEVLSQEKALARASSTAAPDIFMIEADLARPSEGLRLMSELRSRSETRDAVIVIATSPSAVESQATALDLGANDLAFTNISSPFAAQETALRLHSQLRRKRALERQRETLDEGLRLAMVDPLTDLYNRRYASTHLARLAEHALRTKRPFAVMLLDLDRFKSVNDTFGHTAGDEVLTEVASRLRTNLRAVDLIARIGGEEFLVAMPDAALEEARAAAERLRQVIESTPVQLLDGRTLSVTISIGLAIGGTTRDNPQLLVDQADTALLGAKATGRNQVSVARAGTAA
ncbi:diguanylate cyclase [uncultured Thioclava sp.]|uniref:diguanylate cyclase n=1 Tax=Thioclava arctica TaxID=3238301 RepID=A0ABV3TQ85_9RHOB|nr:diguanylate cyclase [uncultured Thioclava sp.]